MRKNIFILAFLMLSFPMLGQAPLAGNYTIDVNGGGDFDSFSEAIDSLDANGISGSVVFNVAAGTYSERVTIGSIAGTSESNTISFIGDDASTTILIPDATINQPNILNKAFTIESGAYLNLENLGFRYGLPESATLLIIEEGSHDIHIKKCQFDFEPTDELNAAMQILNTSRITVDSCEVFAEGDYGIVCIADSSLILSNTKLHNVLLGLYLDDAQGIYLNNNEFSGSGATGNPLFAEGIFMWFNNSDLHLENNIIHEGFRTGFQTSALAYGMNRIVNNVFKGYEAGVRFINLGGNQEDTLIVQHNTFIGGEMGLRTAEPGNLSALHVENNLFASNFGPSVLIESMRGFSSTTIWNHNAYLNSDTSAFPLIRAETPQTNNFKEYHSLAEYNVDYPLQDLNSQYVPLAYLDTAGYNILSPTRFHFGVDTLGFDTDVEGDPRGLFGNAVDVGADEFSGFTGDISHVSGRLFLDENSDGMQNNGESGLSGIKVLDTLSGQLTVTDEHGDYLLYKTDIDPVVLMPEQLNGFSVSPVDSMVLPVATNVEHVDFAYSIDTVFSDFGIDLSFDFRRCFRTINGYITYRNQGTVAEDMIIVSYTPDTLETLESSEPMWDYEVDGTYYWDVEDVGLYEAGLIRLRIRMPGIDGLNIPQTSNIGIANEAEEVIVQKEYIDSLNCAYDPNDKAVFPAGLGEDHLVLKADSLEYLIRFQNTGNDTAFNIRIVDQLSTALDWGSFEFISTSHEVRTELNQQTGQLIFYFDDIQLVDSVANEPESHGFVKFRVHPRADIADSTLIENTAYIYFDFNPPIVTNTVSTLMVDEIPEELLPVVASLPDSFATGALVYPNPTAGTFRIQLPNSEPVLLEAFSIDGRMVHRHHYQQQNIPLDFSGLAKGIYILKVQADDYHFSEKVIIE